MLSRRIGIVSGQKSRLYRTTVSAAWHYASPGDLSTDTSAVAGYDIPIVRCSTKTGQGIFGALRN
jgi:hypothetical protein